MDLESNTASYDIKRTSSANVSSSPSVSHQTEAPNHIKRLFLSARKTCVRVEIFIHSKHNLMCMESFVKRTNVVLDEKKLARAKKAFRIKTTRELLDYALNELLRSHDRKKILGLKGQIELDLDLNATRELRK